MSENGEYAIANPRIIGACYLNICQLQLFVTELGQPKMRGLTDFFLLQFEALESIAVLYLWHLSGEKA